jgi:hypothetical protein
MPEINFLPQATETRVERQHRERGSESKETTRGISTPFLAKEVCQLIVDAKKSVIV